MLAVYTPRLHPLRQFLHTFLSPFARSSDLLRLADSAETKPENNPGRERVRSLPSAIPPSRKIFGLERPDRHKSCPVHVQTAAET